MLIVLVPKAEDGRWSSALTPRGVGGSRPFQQHKIHCFSLVSHVISFQRDVDVNVCLDAYSTRLLFQNIASSISAMHR